MIFLENYGFFQRWERPTAANSSSIGIGKKDLPVRNHLNSRIATQDPVPPYNTRILSNVQAKNLHLSKNPGPDGTLGFSIVFF